MEPEPSSSRIRYCAIVQPIIGASSRQSTQEVGRPPGGGTSYDARRPIVARTGGHMTTRLALVLALAALGGGHAFTQEDVE
jgi:hypothetical protein